VRKEKIMKRQVGLIIFVLIFGALFMAENALAQSKCKTVEVHMNNYWEFAGIDACGVAGWCGEGRIVGTLNGSFFGSGLDLDIEYPSFGDSHVWRGQYTFDTNHGEIFTTTTGVQYWQTFFAGGVATNQESHAVTGGTGRYERATGYFLVNLEFVPPDFFPGTGEMTGQVCWPEN
jgi:hypothetical protein